LGLSKDRPSVDIPVLHPVPRWCPETSSLRLEGAIPLAPSVPAVSHDFDGLLCSSDCGLVASRSRPWGSPGFAVNRLPVASHRSFRPVGTEVPTRSPRAPVGPCPSELGSGERTAVCNLLATTTPHWRLTLRSVPLDDSRAASPQPWPPRRWPSPQAAPGAFAYPTPTSGLCSIIESVAHHRVSALMSPILPWAWHSTKPSPHLAGTALSGCPSAGRRHDRGNSPENRLCTYPLSANAARARHPQPKPRD
jgi:hypothetical protein